MRKSGVGMGACKFCGASAGALKSTCSKCREIQAHQAAEAEARIAQQAGAISGYPGILQAFQTFGESAGEAISAMHAYDFTGDGRLKHGGTCALTTSGVLFALGKRSFLIPQGDIRSVFADLDYINGIDEDWSGYVRGMNETYLCWIQFHDRNLESIQVQAPYVEGNPASLKPPAQFLVDLMAAGYSVTIQDSRLQYVVDALTE